MDQMTATPNSVRAVGIEDATKIIAQAERILIVGCSGTGKSTLAQALANRYDLTYVSMDRDIFWMPGWKLRPRDESVQRIREAVAGARWIMDGNSPSTLPIRLPRTDIVIWRRPPRHMALYGVLKRWWKFRGQTRPEMAPGCPEHIDFEFLRYIWTFERDETPQFERALAEHIPHVPVLTLKSYRESDELLAQLQRVG
jgi:adenylate kinase family enzyme